MRNGIEGLDSGDLAVYRATVARSLLRLATDGLLRVGLRGGELTTSSSQQIGQTCTRCPKMGQHGIPVPSFSCLSKRPTRGSASSAAEVEADRHRERVAPARRDWCVRFTTEAGAVRPARPDPRPRLSRLTQRHSRRRLGHAQGDGSLADLPSRRPPRGARAGLGRGGRKSASGLFPWPPRPHSGVTTPECPWTRPGSAVSQAGDLSRGRSATPCTANIADLRDAIREFTYRRPNGYARPIQPNRTPPHEGR